MIAAVFFTLVSMRPWTTTTTIGTRTPRLFAGPDDAEMVRVRSRATEILRQASGDESDGFAEKMTGAVVGVWMGGPVGMLLGWGAGARLAESGRSQEAKLRKLGVDPELLRQAESMTAEVADAKSAIAFAEDSRDSTKRFEETLRRDRDAAQVAAESAVSEGDDDAARTALRARISLDARLEEAAKQTRDAESRVERSKGDVVYLENRMQDIQDVIARAIVATVDGDSAVSQKMLGSSSLASEDPLLAKFKALEKK